LQLPCFHLFQSFAIWIAPLISASCVLLSPAHSSSAISGPALLETDRLHVSGITERETADACSDARLRLANLQSVEPFLEGRGLQDFEHGSSVIQGSQHVNRS